MTAPAAIQARLRLCRALLGAVSAIERQLREVDPEEAARLTERDPAEPIGPGLPLRASEYRQALMGLEQRAAAGDAGLGLSDAVAELSYSLREYLDPLADGVVDATEQRPPEEIEREAERLAQRVAAYFGGPAA